LLCLERFGPKTAILNKLQSLEFHISVTCAAKRLKLRDMIVLVQYKQQMEEYSMTTYTFVVTGT
jgi:hypothetical protein